MKPPSDMTDDELNAAVAREVMEWEIGLQPGGVRLRLHPDPQRDGLQRPMPLDDWSPTTDIAAAMNDVVRAMTDRGWYFALFSGGVDTPLTYFSRSSIHDSGPMFDAKDAWSCATPPSRAICEAALAAVRSES